MEAAALDDVKPIRRRSKRRTQPQLLMRSQLDNRTTAAKTFDSLVGSIQADLGGFDAISSIEVQLIEAYAGASVLMQSLNTKMALGESVDATQFAVVVSTLVRVANRLGVQRRSKDVTPTLSDYLKQNYPKSDDPDSSVTASD